jgi:phospholipid/cholesterol/gamma-HCH transport system substrate-binding protein
MDRSPLRDFAVGLFVLAGLAAMAYLSISIGGFAWHGKGGLRLSAGFDEIGGLTLRAPVVISGVRVGEVSGISMGPNFRARVDLDLDPTLRLPTDTVASIETSGVLGDRYIELEPGGEETVLKNGDQIAFTEPAMILEKLIGKLVYGLTNGEAKSAKPMTQELEK